ncbi:PREDICTED: uncharacterized protein LOC106750517 [Dinoponera quadriceps]|uniref:Uncharacterized protein LOC106750517 n=1 Tax=Dinoponera quadriceps TaxID=609295 RepID=A0A6P3Y7S2_DINQU|nr:PREDICTED: uncharacterized protein LOC106750517 [Dinoponera quadriceps]
MSASGYWCALILLTFTQDSLGGSHYEKPQIEKPKEYLRHQQNHRSSLADRKLFEPTGFAIRTNNPAPPAEDIRSDRAMAQNHVSTETDRPAGEASIAAETSRAEIPPTAERHGTPETSAPTEVGRPIPWAEIEQTEIERSQIRHGRSRSHFARQMIEDSSKDAANSGRSFDRINKSNVRQEEQESRLKARRADKTSDYQEGLSVYPSRRNHSWLLERNSSKDANGQSLDRAEDNVPEGPESLLKLYQARRGNIPDESFTVPLMRNHFSKDNSAIAGLRASERIKNVAQKEAESALKARHSENHGVLRSSPDSFKDPFKDDPLSKLRKAMSSNKTIAASTDRNTTETIGVDPTAEDTSESSRDLEEEILQDVVLDYTSYEEPANASDRGRKRPETAQVDIVTRFLRIIENQHTLGENCTAGTDLNLGEGVVDQYAQERFRLEANLAVNRANMLTRLWKYAPEVMLSSEYLLHASVLSMVEFDEDIFAAGNCYDKLQYKDRWLYCPFAHRLPNQDGILVKDLAIEYKYLTNSSEWFYIARKNAERVIASYEQFSRGFHTYTLNESMHTEREEDEILTVKYEDGRWSKPYYDCGGGNIWMLTYTVPFFGYVNDTYFFKNVKENRRCLTFLHINSMEYEF